MVPDIAKKIQLCRNTLYFIPLKTLVVHWMSCRAAVQYTLAFKDTAAVCWFLLCTVTPELCIFTCAIFTTVSSRRRDYSRVRVCGAALHETLVCQVEAHGKVIMNQLISCSVGFCETWRKNMHRGLGDGSNVKKVGILVTRHPSATVTSSDNSFLTLKRKATKLVSGKEDWKFSWDI